MISFLDKEKLLFLMRAAILVIGVLLTRLHSYALFHSFVEMIAIVIAMGTFMVIWNSRHYTKNNYYVLIGISFFFLSILEIVHTLSYKGIGVFTGYGSNLPTQLWLAMQYITSLTFLAAPFFIKNKKLDSDIVFVFYAFLTAGVFLCIFYFKIFPTAFVEEVGTTLFKKISEYAVSVVFVVSAILLRKNKNYFSEKIYKLVFLSILVRAASGVVFTTYVDVYGVTNLIGHLLIVMSYFLIYTGIIEEAITKPFNVIFKELKETESVLRNSRDQLLRYAKDMELQKEHEEAILYSMGDGIVATDSGDRIVYANAAFEELVGKNSSVLQGADFYKVVQVETDDGKMLKKNERPTHLSMTNKERVSLGYWGTSLFIKRGSKRIPLAITASPIILRNEVVGSIAIYRDITREKEIDKAKTEFISLTSHQLRTPLSDISLSSELLLRGVDGPVAKKHVGYITDIYESSQRMTNLVNTLLNISRIELGVFTNKPEHISVAQEINSILSELNSDIALKKLDIEKNFGSKNPDIIFDKNIFRIVVENLISNAVKYSDNEGKISVEIKSNGMESTISVADNGCGIPKSDWHKIFQKSFRADNAKMINTEGLGLGLYMTKLLAEKTNSKVWFESKKGKGSKFYFSIIRS